MSTKHKSSGNAQYSIYLKVHMDFELEAELLEYLNGVQCEHQT